MKCTNVLYNALSTNGCFNEILIPNWIVSLSAKKVIIALSDLSKALLSLLNFIGCTSRGAVFVVHCAKKKPKKTKQNKKTPSCYYSMLTNGISFSQIFFLSNQNADLKKQLHELQAKITALSEKQVGKQRCIFNTFF